MEISATSKVSQQPVGNTQSFSRMKQLFLELSNALAAGDVAAAKAAVTALQKNVPAAPAAESNPIAAKLNVMRQALDAGDVKAVRTVYREVNQEGTVSWKEDQDFSLKHPDAKTLASISSTMRSAAPTLDKLA